MSSEPPSRPAPSEDPARYVMVGGFLGAGKTTAIARLGRLLAARGRRVGLITNDQSRGLVDTALLRAGGFAVEEIAGGCFCCRFASLHEAAARLRAAHRPEVFLAEPVGSCTDLVATVSYPLRRIYGDRFQIAPLSVLVDPRRAARVFGLSGGRSFSDKVLYVYAKQLEEADLIVVNKCDALDAGGRERLVETLRARFQQAEVRCISARTGEGVEAWLERILEGTGARRGTIEVDYEVYAEGEARLGWLNATLDVRAEGAFDGDGLLLRLVGDLGRRIAAQGGEVAHLKATLETVGTGMLSVVSLVGGESEPDLRESVLSHAGSGALILNVRAEASPEMLAELVREAVARENARGGVFLEIEHHDCLAPARPVPTWRDVVAEGSDP